MRMLHALLFIDLVRAESSLVIKMRLYTNLSSIKGNTFVMHAQPIFIHRKTTSPNIQASTPTVTELVRTTLPSTCAWRIHYLVNVVTRIRIVRVEHPQPNEHGREACS